MKKFMFHQILLPAGTVSVLALGAIIAMFNYDPGCGHSLVKDLSIGFGIFETMFVFFTFIGAILSFCPISVLMLPVLVMSGYAGLIMYELPLYGTALLIASVILMGLLCRFLMIGIGKILTKDKKVTEECTHYVRDWSNFGEILVFTSIFSVLFFLTYYLGAKGNMPAAYVTGTITVVYPLSFVVVSFLTKGRPKGEGPIFSF